MKTGVKEIDKFAETLSEIKRLRGIGQSPEPVWTAKILEQEGDAVVEYLHKFILKYSN